MNDFRHPVVPGAFDRSPARPNDTGVVFREATLTQASELNEAQAIQQERTARAARLSAADGDRIRGADIRVDSATGRVTLSAGDVFAAGDVRPVDGRVLENVAMTGTVNIGVRLVVDYVGPEDDPTLKGLLPGQPAEGEDGAYRQIARVQWGVDGDGETGDLYTVYRLVNGVPLDTSTPVRLSTTSALLAGHIRRTNGNYISEGCKVTAVGFDGSGDLVLDVAAGTASIYGYSFTRDTALRHQEPQDWTTLQVDGETHTFTDEGGGQYIVNLAQTPLDSVIQCLVEKQATQQVTRALPAAGIDSLENTSVTAVTRVWQGATDYVEGVDYTVEGHRINWGLGGQEPATGSTYDVDYQRLDAVTPVVQTSRQITVTGGFDGGEIIVTYLAKIPRVDAVCLSQTGEVFYIKGVPALNPAAPSIPETALKLAEVHNTFDGLPEVLNNGTYNYPFDDISDLFETVREMRDLIALNRLQTDITQVEPSAKYGVFVDPFTDDRFRDAGAQQNAACIDGLLMLPILASIHDLSGPGVHMLPYTPETAIEQPLYTTCKVVNRFANFTPLPAEMQVTPPVDQWTEVRSSWASEQTQEVSGGRAGVQTLQLSNRVEAARFVRARTVRITIEGFGPGEILSALTFDDVDITPQGVVADQDGRIEFDYAIPGDTYSAGTKALTARGAGGAEANTTYVAEGQIRTQVFQRLITTVVNPVMIFGASEGGPGEGDPRGQIWRWPVGEYGHCCSGTVFFCAVGDKDDPCIAQLRTVDDTGYPTNTVLDEVRINMHDVVVNAPHVIEFPTLPFSSDAEQVAMVILTTNPDHAIQTAQLGGFDAARQEWVTQQPYTVGLEIESSQGTTWAPLHESDLTFSIQRPVFAPTTQTITLGTATLDNTSDMRLRAAADLPTAQTSVAYKLTMEDGTEFDLDPAAGVDLGGYRSGLATLTATLVGEKYATPRILPEVQLVAGRIETDAVYVSRAFEIVGAKRLPVRVKQILPPGTSATVSIRAADGSWHALAFQSGQVLEVNGWVDAVYGMDTWPQLGPTTAVKIEFTGTATARPYFTDLRAWGGL